MGTVTYPDPRVAELISGNFIPVQINIVEHPEFTDRFLEHWTPAIFCLDSQGREHKRQRGYSPPDDFLVELRMGMALEAFQNKRYEEAFERYKDVADNFRNSYLAPEALYMMGPAKYRATGDPKHLDDYWDQVMERYPHSHWARAGDI